MIVHCSHQSMVPIEELRPHPKNNNKHPVDQIKRLAKIMAFQGWRYPIKVSIRSGYVVSGHARIEAAKLNGWVECPVDFQAYDSDEQELADLTADNQVASWAEFDRASLEAELKNLDPSFDIELFGVRDLEMVELNENDPEDIPPPPIVSKAKLGDLWSLGEHRLLCGDSTDRAQVERLMCGRLADLWIADPPFGVSYVEKNAAVHGGIVHNAVGKEIKSDTKSVEELCPFWKSTARCAYEFTTDKASNYWCACQGSDKMMMMMMMDEAGWNIRHELIWVKQHFVFGRSDYHYRHEPIIYGWKKKGTHEWFSDRKQDSVFEIDRPTKSDLHPTTKPVELFSRFIQNSTASKGLVLESFGGSGTTLIACETLGRSAYTMELDPIYVDVILSRWAKFTGKDPVREDGAKWSELIS